MTTILTRALDLEPGDLTLIPASDGITYTFLVLNVEYDRESCMVWLDVAESVHGSDMGVVWDQRYECSPIELVDKLEESAK